MPAILPFATNMLQRLISSAFSSTRSQGSSAGSKLQGVYQAGSAPGRPGISKSPHPSSEAFAQLSRIAFQQASGARRDYALTTIGRATTALQKGDNARARDLLAVGLATFGQLKGVVGEDDTSTATSSRPATPSTGASPAKAGPVPEARAMVKMSVAEALHAGWQANLVRGVDALIANLDDQLRKQQLTDVDPHAPDYAEDYTAFETAAALNKSGRPEEAINVLRDRPHYGYFLQRTHDSAETSESHNQALYDKTSRALSLEGQYLEELVAIVDGNGDAPAVRLGQDVAYARENPVLYTRWLTRTVAIDLAKLGAYEDALATVRSPVPPPIPGR